MSTTSNISNNFSNINSTLNNPAITFDPVGYTYTPGVPYFYVKGSSASYTLTNLADFPFDTILANNGNHFNSSTYKFSAPVRGVYLFTWSLFVNSVAGSCFLKVNGITYNNLRMDAGASISQSALLLINAGDLVSVGDVFLNSGINVNMTHSHFSGILVS